MLAMWRRLIGLGRAAAGGQAMVIYALMLPALVGAAGLALDGGQLYYERRNLQAIADGAAVVGAQVANFDRRNPQILTEGVTQADANARTNGPADMTVAISVPIPIDDMSEPVELRGKLDFIRVVASRPVKPWFMGLFGAGPTTVSAEAVARCFIPGYGVAAVLALSDDPNALRMNGGGGTGATVIGDMISYGGMSFSGTPDKFMIHGSVFALSEPAPTGMTLYTDPGEPTSGSYGTDTGFSIELASDPVVQGTNSTPISFKWPDFPTTAYVSGDRCLVWKEPPKIVGDPVVNGLDCDGNLPNIGNDWYDIHLHGGVYTSGLTIPSGKTVTFDPGVVLQGSLRVDGVAFLEPGYFEYLDNNGSVTMASGAYTFDRMNLGNSSYISGDGVAIKLTFSGVQPALNSPGSADFYFTAWKPYTAGNPPPTPPTCGPYPCNTWDDFVFYVPNGDINLQGAGGSTRQIQGSLYAPNGSIAINGSGDGVATAVVQGQVVASTVNFGGNGPVVDYTPDGAEGTFGPVLVNKLDRSWTNP